MTGIRARFHGQLVSLERDLMLMAEKAEIMLRDAVDALVRADPAAADAVIAADDFVDELYMQVFDRWMMIMAEQSPVAGDLRLLSVMDHTNSHLERIADMGVAIAKISKAAGTLPHDPTIVSHIEEMVDLVAAMLRAAMAAFAARDLEAALALPEMDKPVNRLNRNMVREVARLGSDPQKLEWAIRMLVVSKALERVGDNAVDIAEQLAFLLTGELREFTDASHHD